MGGSVDEAELGDDVAEKVAEALLVHLPPFVPPMVAGRGGAAHAQKLAGVDVYGLTERAGGGRICLGGCWGWCEIDGEVEASFYRPEKGGERVSSMGTG
jgi:hypothetical protein